MVVIFVAAMLFLPPVFQRSFAKMFADFGSRSDLPLLTRVGLSPWYGAALASPALAVLLAGLLARRRVLILIALVAALFGVVAGIPTFLAAMYLPIFRLADKVSAEPRTR